MANPLYKAVICKNFSRRVSNLDYLNSTYDDFVSNMNRMVRQDVCSHNANSDFNVYTNIKEHVGQTSSSDLANDYNLNGRDYIVIFNNEGKPNWIELN